MHLFFSHTYVADSAKPNFKAFAGIIKEESETTKKTINALLGSSKPID